MNRYDLINCHWSQDTYFRHVLSQRIKATLGDKKNLRLLDIGCGAKPYKDLFAKNVSEYIGIDIEYGRAVNYVYDGVVIPFEDNSFDVVFCTSVLEHAEQPWVIVNEAYRVLKPGGTVIFTAPFHYDVHSAPTDYWRFTSHGLRLLFKDYTNITTGGMDNSFLRALWWPPRKLFAILYGLFSLIRKPTATTSFPDHGTKKGGIISWIVFAVSHYPSWFFLNMLSLPFMLFPADDGNSNYSNGLNHILTARKR